MVTSHAVTSTDSLSEPSSRVRHFAFKTALTFLVVPVLAMIWVPQERNNTPPHPTLFTEVPQTCSGATFSPFTRPTPVHNKWCMSMQEWGHLLNFAAVQVRVHATAHIPTGLGAVALPAVRSAYSAKVETAAEKELGRQQGRTLAGFLAPGFTLVH
ncbi:hypothetical protein B0H15DRAFT_949338 [Mycena belliarum]|uniref:Uncharacterized protein n=1 Tax=Mycena belliarum TaxID=1033014 RepID=A0AAD6U3P3_9AGAR|nr:hypothetical protein B0H15DRAFT_949338 [Mycena belliae]